MKAVIDEGVPRRVAAMLRERGHDVSSFPRPWKGLSNGRLLTQVERAGFDCLLTCDRNLHSQQTITSRNLALLVLPAQRFEDIEPFAAAIDAELARVEPGKVLHVGGQPPQYRSGH